MPRAKHVTIAWSCLALVLPLAGCGKPARMKVYPVRGQLLYQGQAAAGAELQLHGDSPELQAAAAPYPKATVLEDGSFTVSSYEPGDGAPAGDYHVTIVWHRSDDADPENREAAPDVLQGKYSSPETSPLTIQVQPQANELPPIELE